MSIFRSVEASEELDRMFALDSRPQPDLASDEAKALAAELTRLLAKTPNPWPGALLPIQALALKELYENKGLLALLRAGAGKTLLVAMAIAISKPERPMVLCPASMLVDTKKTWAQIAESWHFDPSKVTLLSYEKVSTPGSGARTLPDGSVAYPDLITRHSPDFIAADEVHRLANMGSAGTRRLGRYLAANPSTVFVGLSGTFIRRSFKDAAHTSEWALHERSPLPREWKTLEQIADATDARNAGAGKRTDPGVLLEHLDAAEDREYNQAESEEDARAVVTGMIGRRILETPGVISSTDGPLAIPGRLDPVLPRNEDPNIDREILLLLKGDEATGRLPATLPNGDLLPDTKALARPLVTLSLGFWAAPSPPPPLAYREAASLWNSSVRDTIKYRPHLNLDSEWMVKDAVRRGVLPDLVEILADWDRARAQYTADTGLREPPSVATWVSDEAIREVEAWLAQGPGLVWVAWRALGARLSKDLGLAYFGAGKTDASGRHVTDLKKGEPAILSHASVGTGTDSLQFNHHRQLWTTAPNEQSLARLHRPGQLAECVLNDIYLPSKQHHTRFWRSADLAKNFASKIAGPQRLCYFENTVPVEVPSTGVRWGTLGTSDGDVGEDA